LTVTAREPFVKEHTMSTPTTATATRTIGRIVRGCVHHDLSRRIGALSEARALVGRPEFALLVDELVRRLRSSDPVQGAHATSILGALDKPASAILTKQVAEDATDRSRRAVMALGS
jgi:hypothetical protein